MAAPPMTAGLAPQLVLSGGYVLRVTALDPLTGDTNTDVIVSDVSLQVNSPDPPEDVPAFPILSPLLAFTPETV